MSVNAPADPQPGDTFIELRNGVPYIGTYTGEDDEIQEPTE
jgi:hypothetical protein